MQKPRIFVAGHNGMVGSSLVRLLKKYEVEIITKKRSELDLLSQNDVEFFFKDSKRMLLFNKTSTAGNETKASLKPSPILPSATTAKSSLSPPPLLEKTGESSIGEEFEDEEDNDG